MSIKHVFLVSCILSVVGGCASFRGIPSHGGGKRFDEEQRLIAACTYKALEQMELEGLEGKTVKIVHEFTTTYGVGNAGFGGLQDIGLNSSVQDVLTDWGGGTRNLSKEENRAVSTVSNSLRYRPHMSFFSSNANTDRDASYFISCLQMRLRHAGVVMVPKGEEITLYILLDVLGTNRSRKDRLINYTDHLNASCEFTYYAVNTKTRKLVFSEKRSGSIARYSENVTMFIGRSSIQRSVESRIPLEMPMFQISPVTDPVVVAPAAAKSTPKPASKVAPKKKAAKPTAKTAPKPVAKPAAKPVAKSAPKPVAKASPKPAPKVAAKPAPKAAPKAVAIPAPKPTAKPAPKPAAESGKKVAAKPKPLTEAEKEAAREAKELQELGDQAKRLIQAGDSNQVSGILKQIQAIDPAAEELKEISIMLQLEPSP